MRLSGHTGDLLRGHEFTVLLMPVMVILMILEDFDGRLGDVKIPDAARLFVLVQENVG